MALDQYLMAIPRPYRTSIYNFHEYRVIPYFPIISDPYRPACHGCRRFEAVARGYLVLKDVRLRCSFAATDSGGIEGHALVVISIVVS